MPREGWVASIAVAVAVLAVFLPWTSVGSASLDGTQGPNNGWLVAIVGIFALGLTRLMVRGSWVGVVGVLGASIVMFWTAVENWLDNRDVLEGSLPAWALSSSWRRPSCWAASAAVRGLHLARDHAGRPPAST